MNMRWNLDTLYTSFDSDKFKNDLAECDRIILDAKNWSATELKSTENASAKIEAFIKIKQALEKKIVTLYNFAELSLSVDARNDAAIKYIEVLQEKMTELTEPEVSFQKWISSIDNLQSLIDNSEILKEHKFFLEEIIEKNKYTLKVDQEVIISKMQTTGSQSWAKLQELLTSTLTVDITVDGEKKSLPLPVVRNMAYEGDAKTRKTAYEAELKAYEKIAESSAACLNSIKGEVITLSKLKGYSSPLEATLIKSRMTRKTLDAMMEAINEKLPSFRKYYRRKGEILGHKNGLPFYELFAPVGDVDKKYTYEEARSFIVEKFKTFSEKLSSFANEAFEKEWIDAEPREGKRGGAFCSNITSIEESRVLSNFTGSFSDVTTLAHELGHAYHGDCLRGQSLLNVDYPMPIAETASIFCETIITNAVLSTASKEEAFAILETSISDAGQVIVDIYSRYLFETELFEKRAESSLSVAALKDIMLKAQKASYGDGLDQDILHPYMWVCKPHYYYAEDNFYNFPYAFGLLFAKGLYAQYLKKGADFIPEYDKLLAATGKNSIKDVALMAGVDVENVEFWRGSLDLIQEDIEKFLSIK